MKSHQENKAKVERGSGGDGERMGKKNWPKMKGGKKKIGAGFECGIGEEDSA